MPDRDTSKAPSKPQVLREFEFYGGCIRVKISVKNTSGLVIADAALELESDENVLHFDRCEPEYPEKKGKLILGSIYPNTDKTTAFYLDPLICAKEGTDINCRIFFKDAFGRSDMVQMEPLKIKVVCPIFRTEHDINIGRLKELVSGLSFHDSKVYAIPKKLEISELLGTCRNVIQLHDVRHIKTFKTTDEKTYEAWYYGKTKVTKKDLVIKCAICKDTESIEVFASGNDPADITGLLAEIGRNLTKEFERLGKVQPVFNIHIKDSIIQRSNLLSFCNLDGTCGGDVVIEDSLVQRANIASWNEVGRREDEERARREQEEQERLRREEAQKREKEERERLRRMKEQEERTQRERKAREDADRREREKARRDEERLRRQQEEQERAAREREELASVKEPEGTSWKGFLAVALMLGVMLIGYWALASSSIKEPTIKRINNGLVKPELLWEGPADLGYGFVGASPNGDIYLAPQEYKLFKVENGTTNQVEDISHQNVGEGAWGFSFSPDGTLYFADVAGGVGKIFKVVDGKIDYNTIYYQRKQTNEYIRGFGFDLNNILYFTDGSGIYKVENGSEALLYAITSGQEVIMSIAVAKDGTIYFATEVHNTKRPKGVVYRLAEGKEPAVYMETNEQYIYGLAIGTDGSFYITTWSQGGPNNPSMPLWTNTMRLWRVMPESSNLAPYTTSKITPTISPTPTSTPVPDQNTFTNSIGMEFVLIPEGEFDMGSDEKWEGPVHHVKISKAFYLGKYEVTQKQWRDVMGTNPSYFKGDDLPVETVSWDDVQEFIKKLNEKEGTKKYRLPSESEWEYATRAGTTTRYFFGDNVSQLGDYAWYSGNSGEKTHTVGQKKPNSWGLYDIYGNVQEWVQDIWHSNYNAAPKDGSVFGFDYVDSYRVNRGCTWRAEAESCRSTNRIMYYHSDSGDTNGDFGFRLVRDV